MRQRSLSCFPVVLAMLALPGAASAAGFYISDVGVRGIARGGAFIAAPDSLLALHYNPAALTLLGEGAHVELDFVNVNFDYEFQRTCPCADPSLANAAEVDALLSASFRPASNSAKPQDIPFVAVAYQLPWKRLTLALGVYGLTSPGRLKFEQQTQRYNITELELYEAFYQLAVAVEPIEGLRFGLVGMLYDFNITQGVTLWTNTTLLGADDPQNFESQEWDIPVIINFQAPTRLGWAAGVSYSPPFVPGLSFGISALGRRPSRSEGTAAISLPPVVASLGGIEGNKITAEVNLAGIYRFAAQYALPGVFEVEAAAVIEGWSDYDQVIIRGQDIFVNLNNQRQPFAKVVLDTGFQNTLSLRLGGELQLFEPYVGVRAGVFYEPSAVPAELQDVSAPDLDKLGFGLGLATTWFGTTLELGASYVTLMERTVTNSNRHLVGALAPPQGQDTLLTTTGNGTYSGSHLILGASIRVAFDTLVREISGPEKGLAPLVPEATVEP